MEKEDEPETQDCPDSAHDSKDQRICTIDEIINEIGFGPFQILITVFCGLLIFSDNMALVILSILTPAIKCQWILSGLEEAILSSVVAFGILIGGPIWGVVMDTIGRRNGLFIINIAVLTFQLLGTLQLSPEDAKFPGYPWLLTCLFCLGFAGSGISLSFTYYVEFLPLKGRGIIVGSVVFCRDYIRSLGCCWGDGKRWSWMALVFGNMCYSFSSSSATVSAGT